MRWMSPTMPSEPAARRRVVWVMRTACPPDAQGQGGRTPRFGKGRGGGPTIVSMASMLVVEDDEAIAEPLVRALGREGHDVAHTASGETALELAAETAFDVVVLDVGLPGIDGIEVCRRLSERRPRPA